VRLTKQLRGKLGTVIDQIEHGHHVFRAYTEECVPKAVREVLHLAAQ
jgi:hypothetical protein